MTKKESPLKRLRPRLTYANVMSSIAVFLLLGGGAAIAANQLGKNSVGTKQLKKNAVTTADVKKNAITAAKIKKNAITTAKIKKDAVTGAKVNEATLGTVPNAALANSLPPAEPVHLVGAPGEPPFESGSSNPAPEGSPFSFHPVGFWKDHDGVVHLQGVAEAGEAGPPFVFTLPPGFRPDPGKIIPWNFGDEGSALVFGGNVFLEGFVLDGKILGEAGKAVVLDGLTFRAGS
jgi:hypothetical protein